MRRKSGFLSIFLISIILLIAGRFLFFISYISSQKSTFRSELIKHSISEAITIEINTCDLFKNKIGFIWKEKNKELVINGVYHEVLSVVKNKTSCTVVLIEDHAENTLFHAFFNNKQQRNSSELLFLTSFICLTFLNSEALELKPLLPNIKHMYSDIKQTHSAAFELRKIKPPKLV